MPISLSFPKKSLILAVLKECLSRNQCWSDEWCGLRNVQASATQTLWSWVWLLLEAQMYLCISLHFYCPLYTEAMQQTDSSYKAYNCTSTHQIQKSRKGVTLGCTDSVSHKKHTPLSNECFTCKIHHKWIIFMHITSRNSI